MPAKVKVAIANALDVVAREVRNGIGLTIMTLASAEKRPLAPRHLSWPVTQRKLQHRSSIAC